MRINPKDLNWRKAHDILTDIVLPRPIAFVSTVSRDGINNVAPFSYFSPICNTPMIVGFSIGRKNKGQKKDTLVNIEHTKEYIINVVTESLAEQMNKTAIAYPPEISEFEKANLTPIESEIVTPPMVKEAPINIECKLMQILEFGVDPRYNNFVIGEVVKIHVKENFIVDETVQFAKLKVIGRMGSGGYSYCRTSDIFRL